MLKNYEKEYYDKNIIEKTGYFFQTIYNTGKFYSNIFPNLFFTPDENVAKIIYPNNNNKYEKINWKNHSNGLIVVIHGLLGSPKTLGYEIAKKISSHDYSNNIDIILPVIPSSGNCALDISSKPLYKVILDYIIKNPSKPIHLIACSNGCRIASWIEYELRYNNNSSDANIKLTCIAGAFGGSVIIDKFNWFLQPILDDNIINDLLTNSETNLNLIKNINTKLKSGTRFYEFYGTANDWYIPNFNDCFPNMNENNLNNNNFQVIYHDLKYGYDHVSLGWYLIDEIIYNSIQWINKYNNM